MSSAIRHKVMQPKDLKQSSSETRVKFSAHLDKIDYQCDNELPSESKVSAFVFRLQTVIQAILDHETKEL